MRQILVPLALVSALAALLAIGLLGPRRRRRAGRPRRIRVVQDLAEAR